MAVNTGNYGAFMEEFVLPPSPTSSSPPLSGLTFAVKDIFDMEGYVTGFGNPDWLRTHSAATSTAPAVSAMLNAGAICVGRTAMDEMAYSINGENVHYGTPINPCAADRVPGGSSSGSAVAVAAMLADFSLVHIFQQGTDTGGSIRAPASYCGIFGFRPSHGIVSTEGVTPMAQSFDTVGWFSRDPGTLNRVGKILLQLPDEKVVHPSQVLIADDCFKLLSIPSARVTKVISASIEKLYGGQILQPISLGDYVESKVPSLKHFMENKIETEEFSIKSLVALSTAMRLLQRFEFKNNHAEWVGTVKPKLGPGISQRVLEALNTTEEHIDVCVSVKAQLQEALSPLLGENGIMVIPTLPGPPPKLQTETTSLETFRARAFSLLSVAGVSGFCQVSIPLGKYEGLPVSVSLMAKHGSDGFLLNLVEAIYDTLKEQVDIAEKLSY